MPRARILALGGQCGTSATVAGMRQSVGLHNPLFAGFEGGHGSCGISCATLAMWNAVEGASMSFTVRHLGINEKTCRAYYDRAYEIMAFVEMRRQEQIVWGTSTSETVEVELDSTVICMQVEGG